MFSGELLKEMRKKRGMSQNDLADATGFNLNTISRYEVGTRCPSIRGLEKISRALDCSPFDLDTDTISNTENNDFKEDAMKIYTLKKYSGEIKSTHIAAMSDGLNEAGKIKALEYIMDLNKIPDYTKSE